MCHIIVKLALCWAYSVKGAALHELKPEFYTHGLWSDEITYPTSTQVYDDEHFNERVVKQVCLSVYI